MKHIGTGLMVDKSEATQKTAGSVVRASSTYELKRLAFCLGKIGEWNSLPSQLRRTSTSLWQLNKYRKSTMRLWVDEAQEMQTFYLMNDAADEIEYLRSMLAGVNTLAQKT